MRTPLLLLSFFIVTTGLCAQVPGTPYFFKPKKDNSVVTTLDCAGATHNGALGDGVPAAGVSSILSYTDGNGETYSAQNIGSTGVTGLTATLAAGTLNVGAGTLTFDITGTPDGMGIASFAISFGGQSCDLEREVGGLGVIPGNATCTAAVISVTPCSFVAGASVNDDAGTPDGTEYDWTGATGYVAGGATRALVEIGGQCWYRRNADNIPSNFDPVPTWVNSTDKGWSGYYTGGPFTNEGRLYQWKAAMNNSTVQRAQGVCAPGFHVPSDCEWMYLENTLGMSVTDQQQTGGRGTQARKLHSWNWNTPLNANNSAGFTALRTGFRHGDIGSSQDRGGNTSGSMQFWLSSSESPSAKHQRGLALGGSGLGRVVRNTSYGPQTGLTVRCLKD